MTRRSLRAFPADWLACLRGRGTTHERDRNKLSSDRCADPVL